MPYPNKIARTRKYWDSLSIHDPKCSVLDPADTLGHKNRYIRQLTNKAFFRALDGLPHGSLVLDFGCGTGENFDLLSELEYLPIGIDISYPLIKQAINREGAKPLGCIQYDGMTIPIQRNSIPAAITYAVLIYIVDKNNLKKILKELFRILEPGGRLITIEQTSSRNQLKNNGIKIQRTTENFIKMFHEAGFYCHATHILRRGHFPLIYLIRYGFIPSFLFSIIMQIEAWLGKIVPKPHFDYTETLFILEKPKTCRKDNSTAQTSG